MFYIIGLGLGDVKDITVRGLEIVQNASRVYLEMYTSVLPEGIRKMVGIYKLNILYFVRKFVCSIKYLCRTANC